jgi:hypothetical protein
MATSIRPGEHMSTQDRTPEELDARVTALRSLVDRNVPFVVAGAYAFFEYTGIFRDTKDLDIFLCQRDLDAAFEALQAAGFRTEVTEPHWLAKGFKGDYFVDLIYSSGNGIAVVDDLWFKYATKGTVMGIPCLLAPPEEIIWSKGFVNERERYDGADVNHIIHACGETMDWKRLMWRFDRYWEVLFSHIMLYLFAYPSDRSRVPAWVVRECCRRTLQDLQSGDWEERICRGNLISRVQYRYDYEHHRFENGREWDEKERAHEEGRGNGPDEWKISSGRDRGSPLQR